MRCVTSDHLVSELYPDMSCEGVMCRVPTCKVLGLVVMPTGSCPNIDFHQYYLGVEHHMSC